jgi:hypothetical protein
MVMRRTTGADKLRDQSLDFAAAFIRLSMLSIMLGFGMAVGRHGSHPEVQEQTAARGGSLAVKLNAHVAPIVAGHTRH